MPRGPAPQRYRHILDSTALGHLATIGLDGRPQVNPVWFIADGAHVHLSVKPETAKYQNLRANPAVAKSVIDPANPFRSIELSGEVIEFELFETLAWVNHLARKDTGADFTGGGAAKPATRQRSGSMPGRDTAETARSEPPVSILPRPVRRMGREAAWPRGNGGEAPMRVMVMVKATEESEAGIMPETELLAAMGKYNEELINAGIMLAGDGLKPSSQGKRVAFDGPRRTVIDGPFAETRELVAGYWMWDVRDMAEAVAWVKRCPNPMHGPSEIEIRPVFEMADFGEALTPEVAELHGRNRERTESR